jgi:hypothetical protein
MPLVDDASAIRSLLSRARTIAVVGASTDPGRPSHGISLNLARAGYRVIPVNPTLMGESLAGEPFRASLAAIREPVDLVDVFRRPEAVPALVEEAIAAGAPALWLQLGVGHPEAVLRAVAAGLAVVAERCISVDHRRLMR